MGGETLPLKQSYEKDRFLRKITNGQPCALTCEIDKIKRLRHSRPYK